MLAKFTTLMRRGFDCESDDGISTKKALSCRELGAYLLETDYLLIN